jgi:hypothetical protein
MSIFFTFGFKIKLYTWVIDELVVNELNIWFEWLNRVTLHSVQGRLFQFRIVRGKKDSVLYIWSSSSLFFYIFVQTGTLFNVT